MADIPTVYLGQDWTLPVQVLENAAGQPLTGKTVQGSICDAETKAVLAGPVVCNPSHPQADPAKGIAAPVIPAADQTWITPGVALLQITVDGAIWSRALIRVEAAP